MKRSAALVAIATLAVLSVHAALPAAPDRAGPALALERAEAAKGGAKVKKIGERGQDLLSRILGPLAIVLVGAFAISALARREFGQVLVLSVIGLVVGLYIFAPDVVEEIWSGTYDAVF